MPAPPVILSIAGYDPSSGAGVTADTKTAAAFGCYAVTCITALTVQSTQGVFAVEPVRPGTIRDTLFRLLDDFDIAAVRIGMLGSGPAVRAVVNLLEQHPLPNVVLDPVIYSSSGAFLLPRVAIEMVRDGLLSRVRLITPNLDEAALLTGARPVPPNSSWQAAESQIRAFADRLHALGCLAVLITGGHLAEPVDLLSLAGAEGKRRTQEFSAEHIESRSTHGTGCALATAIACLLARGDDEVTAVRKAKDFVRQAILTAAPLGKGRGPLNPLFSFEK